MDKFFDMKITALHGIGEVRARSYERLGVKTVGDLLQHYPRAYENRGDVRLLTECDNLSKHAVVLTVASVPRVALIRRGMSLLKFRAYDDSAVCEVVFFNQDFLKNAFPMGATFRFFGKVENDRGKIMMSSPAYEPYRDDPPLPPFMPIYPLSEGLSQKQVSQSISSALSLGALEIRDPLPEEIRLRHKLCTRLSALRGIHFPQTFGQLAAAKRRLIFDELFLYALGLRVNLKRQKQSGAPVFRSTDTRELEALLPFRLTGAQTRAIKDVAADVSREIPMGRILVGDVGCGKTVCAAAAMLMAVRSGYQATLMAPTEILARQHAEDLIPLFAKLNIRCELLVGAMTASQKSKTRARLAEGEIDIIIGTQALLTDTVEFPRLGLVVVDEQHRFGVEQRAVLTKKGEHVHMLVMSATPIPRSMALALFGDLDMTRIDEIPPGRQKVDTFLVNEGYRARLDGFIRKQVAEGGQVYIVCPAVEESEKEDENEVTLSDITDYGFAEQKPPLKAAVEYAREIADKFPDIPSAFIHGKMKSADKEAVMNRFARGKIGILVSTTVIEVGVNVPNANLMIVENAERFGLSQLHQLRGRVGRGSRKSYCVLVSDSHGETAVKRLRTMCATHDGYEIAESDLKLRGPGDFLRDNAGSLRQSGGVNFRIADMCTDDGLMKIAFEEAGALVEASPKLEGYPLLAAEVRSMFAADGGSIS